MGFRFKASPPIWWRRFRQGAALSTIALFAHFVLLCTSEEAAAEGLRPLTANDLANIREIGGHELSVAAILGALSISPNGDYIAFQVQAPNLAKHNYDLAWYAVETKQHGEIWQIGDGGEVIIDPDKRVEIIGSLLPMTPQWSADSAWVFYLKKLAGNIQLWRSKADGSIVEQLTHNDADLLGFRISEDGAKIFFTTAVPENELSTQLTMESDRGFLYDERFHPDKARKPLGRNCETETGQYPRAVGIERACVPPVWVYDIAMDAERKATGAEAEHLNTISFWPNSSRTSDDRLYLGKKFDERTIFLKNEEPEKFAGFSPPRRLFASRDGKIFRCLAAECYGYSRVIEDAWWRPEGNEVIFLRADGSSKSKSGLYRWNLDADAVRAIVKTEGKLGGCTILKDRAICLREQWTYPRTVVSVDLESGKIETIFDPNPEFSRIKFSKIEKIEWEDAYGNPTHGHLVYPLNYEPGRRYPLIIVTYRSRGFLRGGVGDEYPIHLFAAQGFMVLSHDMPRPFRRHATISNIGLAQFKDNYKRISSLSAQEKILDILDKRRLIDPDRVAITGLSEGASQVMFALMHTEKFAAAIASSALDYNVSYYSHNQQGRAYRRNVRGGAPDEDKYGFYSAMSFRQNAEQVDAPFLINISDWELQNSVESVARLQDAGKPVEMYVFPNEFHIKWQPQHRLAIYRRNVQWLKFWLMGEEEDDPVSPGQYERWRKMRDQRCAWDEPEDEKPSYCDFH